MQSLLRDLRFAARTLRRAPGISLASAATIAVGIAATTVVFSVLSSLLLTPLPVADPQRLVVVDEIHRGGTERALGLTVFSFSRYEAYRKASENVFSGLAGQRMGQGSLRVSDRAEVASTVVATDNYFDVLGLSPAHGRLFEANANRGGGRPSAVLSYDIWISRFGGDRAAIGRTVHVNSTPYEVIGVAPRGFTGTVAGLPADLWLTANAGDGSPASGERLTLIGRLRGDIAAAQAPAAVDVISRQVPPDRPGAVLVSATVRPLTPVPSFARGATVGFMAMLMATAGLVLLIASTNVAGMLLARAVERRGEIAVRMAVGASRQRLIRQLLIESVLLFLIGSGMGVLLTVWIVSAISSLEPPFPTRVVLDIGIDIRVLAFACGMALFTGVAAGLAPAFHSTRLNLLPGLRAGTQTGGTSRSPLRGAFVVVQLALSLVLVVTAGLFARTIEKALRADIGFNPDGVVVATISPEAHGYDADRARLLQNQWLERVRAMPGVETAAFAVWAPMGGNEWRGNISRDEPEASDGESIAVSIATVGEGYMETLQVPLVAGRRFSSDDRPGALPVAMVNETLARQLWPDTSPLGRRVRMGKKVFEVVGVTADGKYEKYTEERKAVLYLSFDQAPATSATLHVRSDTDSAGTLTAVRRELASLDPNIALEQAMPLSALIGMTILPQRIAAWAMAVFGGIGLLLSSIGLYGVLAFQVTARTREIGIRMALGAPVAGVVGMVMRSSLRLVLLGTMIGLFCAVAATHLLASFLYGVTPTDPVAFIAAPLLLLVVSLLASYVPARRAARVEPTIALRVE